MFISQLLGSEEENVHEIITKAKHYIDEHLTEELSVSNIAASLYITPNYFSRLFKRVTKEGCNEYIVRKRIEKAKSLLETTSMKTGKIAMMVGYRDTNYFSLAFKKHTGNPPQNTGGDTAFRINSIPACGCHGITCNCMAHPAGQQKAESQRDIYKRKNFIEGSNFFYYGWNAGMVHYA